MNFYYDGEAEVGSSHDGVERARVARLLEMLQGSWCGWMSFATH